LLLLVLRTGTETAFPPAHVRVKGGEIAVALVRSRDGAVARDPSTHAPGDRFKALLTCAPGTEGRWHLLVVQAGQAFLPLYPFDVAVCGNELPFPGAFTLDGPSPATVCATRAPHGATPNAPGKEAACVVLDAVSPAP
jgi:hypothetical protein